MIFYLFNTLWISKSQQVTVTSPLHPTVTVTGTLTGIILLLLLLNPPVFFVKMTTVKPLHSTSQEENHRCDNNDNDLF